jgi:hypothetical protein
VESKGQKPDRETFSWEELPASWKALYTRESWETSILETLASHKARYAQLERPADWVEPSMTIEQADADPYAQNVSALMKRYGLTIIGRFQYFELQYPEGIPRPWTAELELNVPGALQDRYLSVPPRRRTR